MLSANAVFARSTRCATLQRETGHGLEAWWGHCWTAHKRFLAVVRPRLLLTLGYGSNTSAFGLLMRALGVSTPERVGDVGRRGGYTFRSRVQLDADDALGLQVVGIPHPSYMRPGPLLTAALRRAVGREPATATTR